MLLRPLLCMYACVRMCVYVYIIYMCVCVHVFALGKCCKHEIIEICSYAAKAPPVYVCVCTYVCECIYVCVCVSIFLRLANAASMK
jgi:hypothetical protein